MTNKYNENTPILSLTAYPANSRTHSDEQLAKVADSIREFGFTNPVLVDEHGGIIAGHGRITAAGWLGMTHVPTITLVGLTDAQKRAYVIADNQLALGAGWDMDLLRLEIGELQAVDYDVGLLGFSSEEMDGILAGPLDYGDKNAELDVDGFDDIIVLKFNLPSEDYEEVKVKLYEYGDSPEAALMAALGL